MKLQFVTPDRYISDDICYFLDAAVEAMDMPYDVAFWMRYFCMDPGAVINGPNPRQRGEHPEDMWVRETHALIRAPQHFQRWWDSPKTPIDHKLVCAAIGVAGIRHTVRETAKFISEVSITEAGESSRFFRSMESDTKEVRKFKARKITREGGHYAVTMRDWKPCMVGRVPTKNMEAINALLARVSRLDEFPDEVSIIVTPSRRRTWRKYDRDERKQIRRGIELLTDLIGERSMRDFMQTRKLDIQGEKFSIRIELEHLKESHGGARTKVLVGDDEVCSLCIYTPDTPILDHVASMITHVRAGLEDELIEIGNPYSVTVKEKTGIAVLDKRIFKDEDGPRRERIVVSNVIMPHVVEYVRLGDSPFTKRLQDKMIRRISGHLYSNHLTGSKIPKTNVRFSYPRELNGDEYFNIPAGFVLRSHTGEIHSRGYALDPLTRALIEG